VQGRSGQEVTISVRMPSGEGSGANRQHGHGRARWIVPRSCPEHRVVFAKAMRQATKHSIGATPAARLKRSRNAEQETVAFFVDYATPQGLVGLSRIRRARSNHDCLWPIRRPAGSWMTVSGTPVSSRMHTKRAMTPYQLA
jgi:hypothetical protein